MLRSAIGDSSRSCTSAAGLLQRMLGRLAWAGLIANNPGRRGVLIKEASW
jgi:hypothetical protein